MFIVRRAAANRRRLCSLVSAGNKTKMIVLRLSSRRGMACVFATVIIIKANVGNTCKPFLSRPDPRAVCRRQSPDAIAGVGRDVVVTSYLIGVDVIRPCGGVGRGQKTRETPRRQWLATRRGARREKDKKKDKERRRHTHDDGDDERFYRPSETIM